MSTPIVHFQTSGVRVSVQRSFGRRLLRIMVRITAGHRTRAIPPPERRNGAFNTVEIQTGSRRYFPDRISFLKEGTPISNVSGPLEKLMSAATPSCNSALLSLKQDNLRMGTSSASNTSLMGRPQRSKPCPTTSEPAT